MLIDIVSDTIIVFGALWRRLAPGVVPSGGFELAVVLGVLILGSGVVNDYVAWAVLGLACVGGALALAVR